jgi:CheY-like chemotaxis protein
MSRSVGLDRGVPGAGRGRAASAGPAAAKGSAGPAHRKQRVLAVDDEEVMGYVIQRIVRHLGYDVEWVTSCETALEKIRETRYDVILSDFLMPSMNGQRFYEEIGRLQPALLKRIVFVTGDTISLPTMKFLKSTQVPFLSKPFKIEELEALLAEAVRR